MFVAQVVQMNKIELHLERPLGQKTSDCGLGCRMLSMGRWLGLLVELNYRFRFGFIFGLGWLTLIGKFLRHEPDRVLENSSIQIWVLFPFCSKSGHVLGGFLENSFNRRF